ncbi:hypothetical protein IFO70_29145 [Phormidium tenue FACHB-886]|nr:hypothetical protein [Phormidium tenue FACHB-886]
MVGNDTPLLPPARSDSDLSAEQFSHANPTVMDEDPVNNGLTKVAIGVIVGATLGGVAGALANPGTVERINQTVRGVGEAIKKAAANVNDNVQTVGDAVHSVSTGVNNTVKDVGDAVKGATEGINNTVKGTLNTVKHTAEDINGTVKDTFNDVKDKTAAEAHNASDEEIVSASDNGTLYKLVPINPSESSADA